MFVAILIAAPGALDPELVHALRNAWGGGDVLWLSPDEAAEFPIAQKPGNQDSVWQELQDRQVDLVIVPAEGRRKKVLLADMDSTMIQQECIDELADAAGVGDQVKTVTARAMNGELNFETALIERVALLEGKPASLVADVLSARISYTPGGAALVATMKAHGGYAALVSGGFTAFTSVVSQHLGFDENRANSLLSEDGVLTGQVGRPILGRQAKVEAMEDIITRLGIGSDDVIAVGDGANDLAMLHKAGIGVALHAKPAVADQCEVRINHGDLSSLLFVQGYDRDSFSGN